MTTENYFDVSPEFPYKTLFILLNGFGLIIEILTIIHTVIILRLSRHVSVIHPHMLAAAYSFSTFHISNVLFWYPLNSSHSIKFAYDFFKDAANMGVYIIPVANVCERECATILVNNYENWCSYGFIFSLCSISWIITLYLTVHLMFFHEYMNILYLYLGYNVFNELSYVIYFALYYYEKTAKKSYLTNTTLSQRYQRAKNQACFQTMFRFALSASATVVLACVHNVVGLFVLPNVFPEISHTDKIAFFRMFITMCVSIVTLFLPLHFAHVNLTLLRHYKQAFMPNRVKPIESATLSTPNPIQSISGKNMVLSDETQYYFESLKKQWNVVVFVAARMVVSASRNRSDRRDGQDDDDKGSEDGE
uniref:G_PROTEIN_RECEP_F1_2 domain-containing protein n=1 Tax=Panagrellus redivivus TaxID=6233 RepID=A0A7E4VBZ8_PANRE